MTSYANDTTATATTITTTTTTAAAAATPPPPPPAETTGNGGAAAAAANVNANCQKQMSSLQTPPPNYAYEDNDNDSSDGREKADTTPENIKKIAEIIGDNKEAATLTLTATPTSPRSAAAAAISRAHIGTGTASSAALVGLGAAIDESNVKFCLGKPPPLPAEKASQRSSSNNNNSNNNNYKAEPTIGSSSSSSNKGEPEGEAEEEEQSTASNTTSATKQSLSFTIDHFEAKDGSDAAAQAMRYKNMMERFQSRHRRGASMSKLENESSPGSGRQSQRSSMDASSVMADEIASPAATPNTDTPTQSASTLASASASQVKLRVRERSASRVRDASKRHSWSPRSSSAVMSADSALTQTPTAAPRRLNRPSKLPPPAAAKGAANQLANRTPQFTPRSTAMQMAMQQVQQVDLNLELLCPQPPLADGRQHHLDVDAISEAGTYTLDGDNYTEEQKDLMNIDAQTASRLRPKQLALKSSSSASAANRGSNVLEVNYYHETPLQEQKEQRQKQKQTQLEEQLMLGAHQSAGAYLEQLKSRVLRQQHQHQQQHQQHQQQEPALPSADVGCFTSVTTSGVLAKQRALDTHPQPRRHTPRLSTSQIDSSEYVSNEAKLKHAQALAGTATDHQKAEYRLNVFTTTHQSRGQEGSTGSSKYAATRQLLATPPDTPTTPTAPQALLHVKELSDTALLQTAQTKQDWIQEWARNARARSLAQDVSGSSRRKQSQDLMTRSYHCSDTGGDSLTDDSLYSQQRQYAAKLNRTLAERYRLLGDCDYASDPALCSHGGANGGGQEPPYKPPKSPSKIPSPLHTLGRARSASRSRAALPPELMTGSYLEQTAAAISSLQQSLCASRKSSLKSPAHSASPQHQQQQQSIYRRSPLHRGAGGRDALMTSSINEAQLQLLTSGEYLLKQLRRRKNSLDDAEALEPVSPLKQQPIDAASLSPLRRSSSFSTAKLMGQQPAARQARPNFQNLYTPPAARHSHALSAAVQLKKSASSNNFGQAYDDYDDHLQYYINDEDELANGSNHYYSSEEEEEAAVPLSNTRLNKALLMRIERSKQRVAGNPPNSNSTSVKTSAKPSSAPAGRPSAALQAAAGQAACPNTPELPRRGIRSAPKGARQSMPRETSLSRLAQQVPSSLASAKKQLLQTAASSQRSESQSRPVQPKYMDISKYKPAQSNNFLRKNDAKSTLKPAEQQMKRSPSASSMSHGLSRGEATRASNRSVRSTASAMQSSTHSMGGATAARASSAARRDASINKQKEAEMAMWKRRSTYDPMKAAAEDRRKKEESRRAQAQAQQRQLEDEADDAPFESVLRPANNLTITGGGISYSPRNSMENDAWTLGESSEFDGDGDGDGEYADEYDEDEEADYIVDQESDDVFDGEAAEAAGQVD